MKHINKDSALDMFNNFSDISGWKNHSLLVANAACSIAKACDLDDEKAYVLGLLHDVGRSVGIVQASHIIEGYKIMKDIDMSVARICLTHTFQYKDIDAIYDSWDCSCDDKNFVKTYLEKTEYNDWDLLIQFCDSVSLVDSYCTVEKKMLNSTKKYGYKPILEHKFNSIINLKKYFDALCKTNVYNLLEGEGNFEY